MRRASSDARFPDGEPSDVQERGQVVVHDQVAVNVQDPVVMADLVAFDEQNASHKRVASDVEAGFPLGLGFEGLGERHDVIAAVEVLEQQSVGHDGL